MDSYFRNIYLDYNLHTRNLFNSLNEMTKNEAKNILDRIFNNPSLEDQFTEEEIIELKLIAEK